ncbi:MAG: DUF362 domain-containing protein [Nitrospirae bacterium]|nr:DUF362 domain-containing protein [Nitrospirota bacterium]
MNRRKFIKIAGIGGIGISFPACLDHLFTPAYSAEPDLAVASGSSAKAITKAAVDALGGMKSFISKGDIVVVKPNMAWDRLPEQAANTNPHVVAEIVRLCIEAGAKKVRVFDRTVNDPRRCYIQSGIKEAVEEAGGTAEYVDERRFKNVKINGVAIKEWPLYTEILEADKVINVPILKHHGLAKVTMSMKNWMGIMGSDRSRIHQKLDQSLVDVSSFVKPSLTVLDAVRVLAANGPQGGDLSDVKTVNAVIAGRDQVAVDSYGAALFGVNGSEIGYVRLAAEQGHGVMELEKLNIRKISL